MAYMIGTPDITEVTLAPNPTAFSEVVAVSVTITERSVILEPVWYFSGAQFSGEEQYYGN